MGSKNQTDKQKVLRRPHCLVLPLPSQSYMDPMLQFAKRLQDKGIKVTLILTRFYFNSLHKSSALPFPVQSISDGSDNVDGLQEAESFELYFTRFEQVGSRALAQLLKSKKLSGPVDCIVYSAVLPWALDVGKKFGLVGAAFFSRSCAMESVHYHYHLHQGLLEVPLQYKTGMKIMVDGLPPLEYTDLPSLFMYFGYNRDRFKVFMNQFSNVCKADWLFCNTFYELEKQEVESKTKLWRFRTIGPHVPSSYMDKRLYYDKGYDLHRCKPGSRACIKWLRKQPEGSVVYLSPGSFRSEEMKEIAWGIKGSKRNFLWEVEESQLADLPKKFLEETDKQGLVVSNCPQVEVLAQRSIGCFVTDCGWNSIVEAKSFGVPMVAMPGYRSDQTVNAKYVTDVWETGVRALRDVMGIRSREIVESCIREVMEGERAGQMKRNALKWKELAREAVDEGGSSDRNMDEFVASLFHVL